MNKSQRSIEDLRKDLHSPICDMGIYKYNEFTELDLLIRQKLDLYADAIMPTEHISSSLEGISKEEGEVLIIPAKKVILSTSPFLETDTVLYLPIERLLPKHGNN